MNTAFFKIQSTRVATFPAMSALNRLPFFACRQSDPPFFGPPLSPGQSPGQSLPDMCCDKFTRTFLQTWQKHLAPVHLEQPGSDCTAVACTSPSRPRIPLPNRRLGSFAIRSLIFTVAAQSIPPEASLQPWTTMSGKWSRIRCVPFE